MKPAFGGEDVEFSLRSFEFEFEVPLTHSFILKGLLSGSM